MFFVVKHDGLSLVDIHAGGDLTILLRDKYADDLEYIRDRDPSLIGEPINFADLPDYLDIDHYDDIADAKARAIDAWNELRD